MDSTLQIYIESPGLRAIAQRAEFAVPAAAALAFGGACALQAAGLATAVIAALAVLLLAVSSVTDIRQHRIPNQLTYSVLLAALLVNALATFTWKDVVETTQVAAPLGHFGFIGFQASLLGAIACFGAMLCVYYLAGSGAGDVKLAAALGAILGVNAGVTVILWAHVVAGLCLWGWMIWQIGPWRFAVNILRHFGSLAFPMWVAAPEVQQARLLSQPVPMALFFAVGTIIILCDGAML